MGLFLKKLSSNIIQRLRILSFLYASADYWGFYGALGGSVFLPAAGFIRGVLKNHLNDVWDLPVPIHIHAKLSYVTPSIFFKHDYFME